MDVGPSADTPGVIKIVLVTPHGEEKPARFLDPNSSDDDIFWWVENYLGNLNSPIKAIRVYRGQDLISEENIEAR